MTIANINALNVIPEAQREEGIAVNDNAPSAILQTQRQQGIAVNDNMNKYFFILTIYMYPIIDHKDNIFLITDHQENKKPIIGP